MKKRLAVTILSGSILTLLLAVGCKTNAPQTAQKQPSSTDILHARFYNSHFKQGDDNYNACFQASNGKVYYVIASGSPAVGAQMYALDPATGKIQHVGDLTAASGEKGMHAVPQGKGHSIFVEYQGKLYFATHLGYYNPSTKKGQEITGAPPPGYKPYPGGHFLSYDLKTGKFQNIAKAPAGEGIIAFEMDTQRKRLYGLTWPSAEFLRYDLKTHQLRNFGPVSKAGEKGIPGSTFRVVCRILVVDPLNGDVYFTTAGGRILRYDYAKDSLGTVQGCNLRKDVFGCMNPSQPGNMAYNWRQAFWYAPQKLIYAQNGRSGYLFRFNPKTEKIDVLTRLASDASRASGMFDGFSYGYLGMQLGPDGHTIYLLTGSPKKHPMNKSDENIHLVTYNILTGKQVDWGVLQLKDGKRPFFAESIAIGRNGMIYAVSKIHENGHVRVDLLSFPNPVH